MNVEVTLPLRIVSEANQRGHWSKGAKRAKEQRSIVALVLIRRTETLIAFKPLPIAVTLTRIAPRNLDGDNLQRALKAVRDGVADALGIDDGDERIEWRYGQRKPPGFTPMGIYYGHIQNGYGVHIRIEGKLL